MTMERIEAFREMFYAGLLGDDPNWVYERRDLADCALLVYCLRGGKHRSTWNLGGSKIRLIHDQLLIAPPGIEKHGAGNETFYVMIVPPFIFEEAITYTDGRVPRKPLVMDVRGAHGFSIDSQAASALRLYTEQPPLWELEAKLRVLNLLARAFAIYLENSHAEIPNVYRPEHSAEHRIDHLVEFLGKNPSALGGVPEMAKRCLMSEATFFRKFKRSTGFTPQQLLIRLRIGKACELLADTAMPISQAAYQSGFRSVQNFNYAFKTKMGMTPGEFRTQHQRDARVTTSAF